MSMTKRKRNGELDPTVWLKRRKPNGISMSGALEAAKRANLDIEIATIHTCWRNGLTLSQAYKRMNIRYKFTNKKKLIDEWRELKRVFGCASLPVWRH